MTETTKKTAKSGLPPTTARTIDLKKVYALLYQAYVRSQSPVTGKLTYEKENDHE